jgi:hypothetical protein
MAPRRRVRSAPAKFAPENVACSEQVLLPVFLALAEHSSPETVAVACCTCKSFREVGSSDIVWRKLWKKVLGTELETAWATRPLVINRDNRRDGVIKELFKMSLLRKKEVELKEAKLEELRRMMKSMWNDIRELQSASTGWY